MPKSISIVIPFHNEAESLRELLPLLREALEAHPVEHEIILVDDCSNDESADVVRAEQARNPQLKLIRLKRRGGQTECYRAAFAAVQNEYIIRMDADLQDHPDDLPRFFEKIDQGCELIMGVRECRKHSRFLRVASGLYDLLIILLFNTPLHFNTGSFVCLKSRYMKDVPFRKNDHRYLPLIALRRGAAPAGEVFVRHQERKYGASKYKPFKKILFGVPEVLRFLLRMQSGFYDFEK